MSKEKIIDLEISDDGTYVQKEESKRSKPPKTVCKQSSNAKTSTDEFLGGIDIGLDFIENVLPRVDRIFKLRG